MMLTQVKIRATKSAGKPVRLFDGHGLYLEVMPAGNRWWRFKYRFAGKEKRISLGVYPETTLKEARDRRDAVRKQLAGGVDPSEARKLARVAIIANSESSFEVVAREWFEKQQPKWEPDYGDKLMRRLEANVFPWIGVRPIRDLKAPEMLSVLRRVEARGVLETAHRILNYCGSIFRYAIATGRAERDVCADLRGALPPTVVKHFAAITEPKEVAALLRAIDGYHGSNVTKAAMQLAPLLFVRPGELRQAEWSEFSDDLTEWRIPPDRMKMKTRHIVPLSKQAAAILENLRPLTGKGRYVFPGEVSRSRPMSNNTVNTGLRRLGYTGAEMTGHGFRAMASTLLNEQGWNRDAIERQLSHGERNSIRAAYNYAEFLAERRKMMQAWADYLQALKSGAKILGFGVAKITRKRAA